LHEDNQSGFKKQQRFPAGRSIVPGRLNGNGGQEKFAILGMFIFRETFRRCMSG
jgi:hypothetical protein